ncbi:MAG: hypothetical protein ABIS23_05140 [Sphingomicrobium sp.]
MRTAILIAALTVTAPVSAAPATSPQAARQIVQSYYAAINRGDYRTAYLAWDQNGAASGKSFAVFRRGFSQTANTRVVTYPAINGDAGMSQRWIDVPVDVYATLKNGRRQHFRGRYTLHRVVAGVGAPLSQQNWHLSSAQLVAVSP